MHQLDHRILDVLLGAGVDARGRLIEDEDLRVGQKRPPDREQLPLPLREARARAGEQGVIAIMQVADERMAVAHLRRLDHPRVRGGEVRVFEVPAHRVGKEHRVLQHDGRAAPQAAAGNVADVDPIDQDLAAVDIIKAHEQVDNGRLPAAGGADKGHLLPGMHREAEVMQHLLARHIGEIDIFKADNAAAVLHRVGAALILRLLLENGEHPLRAGNGCLDLPIELGQLVDRPPELLGIDDEGRDHPDRNDPPEGEEAAHRRDDDKPDVADEVHDRPHRPAEDLRLDARLRQLIRNAVKAVDDGLLLVVGDHRAVAGDHLLHRAVEGAEQLLAAAEEAAHRPREVFRRHNVEHDRQAGQKRQLPAVAHHHHHRAENGEHAGHHRAERLGNGV